MRDDPLPPPPGQGTLEQEVGNIDMPNDESPHSDMLTAMYQKAMLDIMLQQQAKIMTRLYGYDSPLRALEHDVAQYMRIIDTYPVTEPPVESTYTVTHYVPLEDDGRATPANPLPTPRATRGSEETQTLRRKK